MTNTLSLDFETRSRRDLGPTGCGAYKYSECPSTEVLIAAVRQNRGPILTWDIRQQKNDAIDLLSTAITEGWEIHAWNAPFEWVILKNVLSRQLGTPIPKIEQMRCTAAVARTAGCPPSLDKAGEFLRLQRPKDKIGRPLINRFSKLVKGRFIDPTEEGVFTLAGTKTTNAAAFDLFVDYCANDVAVECQIADLLKSFKLKGAALDSFLFDMRMNERGVPVHEEALRSANQIINEHAAVLSKQFQEITGFTPGQRDRVLQWLKERGYRGDSMKVEVREERIKLDTFTPEAAAAMDIASKLAFVAVKKVPKMLQWMCNDGRIHGAFLWYGAQKTGRWTSKACQFQNAKRPPKWLRPVIESMFQDIAAGMDRDTVSQFYGDPYEMIACLARYFVRFDGRGVLDADFSSVEARILPELIRCKRILDKFRSGDDPYIGVADAFKPIYPLADRDMGKVITLALQFEGGWNAVNTATKGKLTEKQCREAVRITHEANPEFKPAWKAYYQGWVDAMKNEGQWQDVFGYVQFGYTTKGPFPRMMMRLPSGRSICYPYPQRDPVTMVNVETRMPERKVLKWVKIAGTHDHESARRALRLKDNQSIEGLFTTEELSFYGHVKGRMYGRVGTRGGDLLQSATQGTGADLLAHGCVEAEKRGFDIFFVVHDQCLAPDDGRLQEFIDALCTVPDWFRGFPLEADGKVELSYCKS